MNGNKIVNGGSFKSSAPNISKNSIDPRVTKAGKGGDLRATKTGAPEAYRTGKESVKK